MLNHSGKVPEIPFLWVSALCYEVPQLAKDRPCSKGIFSSPLALVLLQPNLWHVPEVLPENSKVQRTEELQGSIHLLANTVEKACMVFIKIGSIFWKPQRICFWQIPKFWPSISKAFFAIIQHIALHHRVRSQSFTNTAVLHGRLKALDFYLSPPALTSSTPCKMHSALNAEIHKDPFLWNGSAGCPRQV